MKKGLIEKNLFIIDYIRKFQPVARHVISNEFNMNRATVGNIVEALINSGFIMELPSLKPAKRNAGRPPIGLKLNPSAGNFIGVDIYDCQLTAVLTDFECRPVAEYDTSFHKEASAETILNTVQEAIETLAGPVGKRKKLKGIGLGLPGQISLKEGIAVEYSRIPNWQNIPFGTVLQTVFKTPVLVEHNSSTVALAEAWNNHPQTAGIVTAILIRTGVSFGIIQNREIINSGTYSAGELGHTVINFDGPPCRCGRKGCLETYVSGTALTRIVEEETEKNPAWPGSAALKNGTVNADLICQLVESGDTLSISILSGMFRYLSIGLDTIMCLYAPDIITIDGIFNRAEPLLREVIKTHCKHPLLPETQIYIAPYDSKSGAIGAALHAASHVCNPLHHLL
jgi:predicted NBD/HSP70 family sugar kinase